MTDTESPVDDRIDWLHSDPSPQEGLITKEREAPFTLLAREYDSETPLSFDTGRARTEYQRPREYGPMAGMERREVSKPETASLYFNTKPVAGTILEVSLPGAKLTHFEVKDPLANINALPEDQRSNATQRRESSIYVQRILTPDDPRIAAARNKEGGLITFDVQVVDKQRERDFGHTLSPTNSPEIGMTAATSLQAKKTSV